MAFDRPQKQSCKREFSFSRQLSRSNSSTMMKPVRQSINRPLFITPPIHDRVSHTIVGHHQQQQQQQQHQPGSSSTSGNKNYVTTTSVNDVWESVLPNAVLYEERESGIPFDLTQVTLEPYRRRECQDENDYDGSADGNSDSEADDNDDDAENNNETDCQRLSQQQQQQQKEEQQQLVEHHATQQQQQQQNGMKSITYHQQYVVYYKQEAVCVFRTSYYVHAASGVSGQSLSMTWRHRLGELQARILHKGRTVTGQGWNTQERKTYRVVDLLEASAKRYGKKKQEQQQQQVPRQVQQQQQQKPTASWQQYVRERIPQQPK